MADDTLIRSLQKVRETFDPGGNLPEDCAAWAREHEQAIDDLAALLRRVEPPQVPQEMTALDLEAIKEWLAEGSYHNREDWGATSLDCAEPCIEALLAEVERLRAALVPPQGKHDPQLSAALQEIMVAVGPAIADAAIVGASYGPREVVAAVKELVSRHLRVSAGSVPASPPELLEDTMTESGSLTDQRVFYGPHPCALCGRNVARASHEDGGDAYDYPDGPIYPNTRWQPHQHGPIEVDKVHWGLLSDREVDALTIQVGEKKTELNSVAGIQMHGRGFVFDPAESRWVRAGRVSPPAEQDK